MAAHVNRQGHFFRGFLIGGILDAWAGIFFAPKSGKEPGSDIKEKGSAVKDSEAGAARGVRCVALFALLAFANPGAVAFAQSSACPGIHVKVLNIRNSTGTVDCALFDSSVGFPIEVLASATNVMIIKIRNTEAHFVFEDIPPGTYALAVIHDENMNGKLDTNWLGIPTEGYGFSNDAKALLGAPSFSAASFQYDGGTLDLTIVLCY